MERHYILASHGMFSQGIYDSIRIILGEKKHVHLITAYVKDGQDISDLIKETMKKIPTDAEIIACTDLFGGSVNNELMKYIGKEHFHLLTGMNLPMLMNLFLFSDEDADKLIRRLFTEAKTGIMYCNETVKGISSQGMNFKYCNLKRTIAKHKRVTTCCKEDIQMHEERGV